MTTTRIKSGEAAAVFFGGSVPKRQRKLRVECSTPRCDNSAENRWGTCDECQDAAYSGDANGEW